MQVRTVLSVLCLLGVFVGDAVAHPGHSSQALMHHDLEHAALVSVLVIAVLAVITIIKKRN